MLNIKRAFETMNKEGSGTSSYYSSYYRLSNSNVLVSNGRVIVTVSDALFEENKDILNNLHENSSLLDIARENTEQQIINVRETSLMYKSNCKLFRILKSEQGKLVSVNEKYLQVFNDCEKSHFFVTTKPKTSASAIKTPLFNCVVIEGTIYDFNCILPVYMDCEALLNKVLN